MELPTIMLHSPQAFSVDEENGLITVDGKTVEKKYYCQRCLNHDLLYPRKGHKTECIFAACPCAQCAMVEQRRQLNNMLSKKRVVDYPHIILNGRKVRDPKCARCYAHGIMSRLRGHKKDCCEFARCTCEACLLVDTRRNLMARQIRLRRLQVRSRKDGAVAAAAAAAAVAAAVAAPPDPEVRLPSVEALESIPAIVRPVAVVPPPITISPIMLAPPPLPVFPTSALDLPHLHPLLALPPPQISPPLFCLPSPTSLLPPPPTFDSSTLLQLLILQSIQNCSFPQQFPPSQ